MVSLEGKYFLRSTWLNSGLWIGIVLMPDPNFHVEDGSDPGRHQNDADPHADPTPSFTHVGKSKCFFTSRRKIASLQ
jgi:hypothetical protein